MDAVFAVVADGANQTRDGKLNIFGIFDRVAAPAFPAQHSSMALVVKIRATPAERGETLRLTIRLLDEDGKKLVELNGQSVVPDEPNILTPSATAILDVRGLPIPHPGTYAFCILVNGEEKARAAFDAVLLPRRPGPAENA